MWYVPLVIVLALGAFLGFCAPEWVTWVLTAITICGILLAYTVNAASRSLFGRLGERSETPFRELSFHGEILLIAFFVSMWIFWTLRW